MKIVESLCLPDVAKLTVLEELGVQSSVLVVSLASQSQKFCLRNCLSGSCPRHRSELG